MVYGGGMGISFSPNATGGIIAIAGISIPMMFPNQFYVGATLLFFAVIYFVAFGILRDGRPWWKKAPRKASLLDPVAADALLRALSGSKDDGKRK